LKAHIHTGEQPYSTKLVTIWMPEITYEDAYRIKSKTPHSVLEVRAFLDMRPCPEA